RRRVQGASRPAQGRKERDENGEPGTASMTSGPGVGEHRSIGAAAAVIIMVTAAATLFAQNQSTEVHIRSNAGQSITPIYEGWERVPDGSFNMVFGYLNRNHVEQISLPV